MTNAASSATPGQTSELGTGTSTSGIHRATAADASVAMRTHSPQWGAVTSRVAYPASADPLRVMNPSNPPERQRTN